MNLRGPAVAETDEGNVSSIRSHQERSTLAARDARSDVEKCFDLFSFAFFFHRSGFRVSFVRDQGSAVEWRLVRYLFSTEAHRGT